MSFLYTNYQYLLWEIGFLCLEIKSILILLCLLFAEKVALLNSVISDMSGGFLIMILLYLWPMLLYALGWTTVTHFSRVFLKFNLRKLQCIQNSAARIVSNTSRCTSKTPVLKNLHWLPVEHRSVFKTATLVYKFLHTGFPQVFCSIHLFLQQLLQYQAQSEWW